MREREIVSLIDDGLSNKEIGHRLHIEVATVKNHVHSILEKLHVTTRAEAAAQLRRGAAQYGGSRLRRGRQWVGAWLAPLLGAQWIARSWIV
jgi:DNA-binding CsgD family transcriptional regulator